MVARGAFKSQDGTQNAKLRLAHPVHNAGQFICPLPNNPTLWVITALPADTFSTMSRTNFGRVELFSSPVNKTDHRKKHDRAFFGRLSDLLVFLQEMNKREGDFRLKHALARRRHLDGTRLASLNGR